MPSKTKYFSAEPQPNLDAVGPSDTPSLTLAYRTIGSPDKPAIFMPSCFGGTLDTTLPFLYRSGDGTPPVLDGHYIIICGMLGAGESSSPSNAHPSIHGPRFPRISYEDNIRLQHALCEALGVTKLAAYIGFSMGGQQAYHMATLYPDFVERIVVLAGSARTSWHNWMFLEGAKAALVNSVDFQDGNYAEPAVRGTRALARVTIHWALSDAWFHEKAWEKLGFKSLEECVVVAWEGTMGTLDANDLVLQIEFWQRGDISQFGPVKGDLPTALESIKAKVLVMTGRGDRQFPLEDTLEEMKHLKHGENRVIESVWGHLASNGAGTKEDTEFIKAEVKRFLSS